MTSSMFVSPGICLLLPREIEKNSVGSGEQSFMESIHFKSVQSFQWIAPFFRSFHLRRSISSPTSIQRLSIGLIIFELNNTCKKGGGIQQIKIGIEIIRLHFDRQSFQYIKIWKNCVTSEISYNIEEDIVKCMFHFVYLSSNDRIMQQSQGTHLFPDHLWWSRIHDEAGIPHRALSLSLHPYSSRLDNGNENCNHGSTTMDIQAKVDKFTTFVPRKLDIFFDVLDERSGSSIVYATQLLSVPIGYKEIFLINQIDFILNYCCRSDALQRSESLSDDQTNLTKIVPVSASQSMVISCDNSKSFFFKSITPYEQQGRTARKMPSELILPSVPPSSSQSINDSLASNQTLPLPHCSFSVPMTNTTTGLLSHGPYYDRTINDNFYKNRDPILVKEVLQEGHCYDNAPRKLRLKTTEGPSSGLLSTYGRPGWYDGSRQSTLSYSSHGASRFYTRPSPSLPLLPLGQTYGRGIPRRLMLNNNLVILPELLLYLNAINLLSCEAESFGESACNISNRFKSDTEACDEFTFEYIREMCHQLQPHQSFSQCTVVQTLRTLQQALHHLLKHSETIQIKLLYALRQPAAELLRILTHQNQHIHMLNVTINHARASPREGTCELSMHSSSKYSKKTYDTNLARSPVITTCSSLQQESSQSIRSSQINSVEYQQNFEEDKNIGRPLMSLSTLPNFSAQLVQTQITSTQAHLLSEFETSRFTSDLSSCTTNTTTSVIIDTSNACDDIRTSDESVNIVSRKLDSRTSIVSESAIDGIDSQILSADKPKKLLQDYFLDEDSLLENLPKFEHCNENSLTYELTRSLNWPRSKSISVKPDLEIYSSDKYVSRQKKEILQSKSIHRSTSRNSYHDEVKLSFSETLHPVFQNLNLKAYLRHLHIISQKTITGASIHKMVLFLRITPHILSQPAMNFRERSVSKTAPNLAIPNKFYMSNMDRKRDRSQFDSSDRHFTPRMANVHRSANRSSFISHGKSGLNYHGENAENSFSLVLSDDKRSHGIIAADCLLHRNIKRNSSNRSRNSPPVYLALKSHREFVDVNNTETKTAHDVEQLTGLFCQHVAVYEEEEIRHQNNSSLSVVSPATIGVCDHISVDDRKITEKSVSPAGSITEEISQQRTVGIVDAGLNFSRQEPPESSVSDNGGFELSKLDVLSEEIWYYHKAITQTENVLNRKLHLRDVLYYAISPVFPMCGLYVVGSSLNGFGTNSSDMDLCLMITNKDLDQRTDAVVVLNMIQSALAETKWISHMQLILAKVPILRIRFYEPFTDITVDLNANNSVAIRNTHLLCYYSSFDWRVRPLVSVVKEWAKRRDINDANRSSFTSYSLVLMVIHYLQCGLKQPILPSLQVVYPKRFSASADVRSLNVSSHLEPPPAWVTNETITLGELLIGFLEYYAFKFDYLKDAISVRLGSKTERTVVARQPSPYNSNIAQWNCICIEEPFTLSNTAHSVHNQMVFDAIRQAFVDGCCELDSNRDLKAFLDVGPINVSIGSSIGSSAQLSILAQSEAGSSTTTSSTDVTLMSRHLPMVSPQSNKEECEPMKADELIPLDTASEMELETAVVVSFDKSISVEEDMSSFQCSQRNSLVNYESEVTNIANVGKSSKCTIDFIENAPTSRAKPETKQISKTILFERQPKQFQMKSRDEKLHINSTESFEFLTKEKKVMDQQEFADKIIVQRRRKASRRMHVSMGCADRNRLNKSKLRQSIVRMGYRSGTASS
ncbi:Poly(A) RNA polymerase GLD2 [Dirofilaria immitis]|nr:Poly(A) RNA polymerase GLD2 [Dirofilaria immitis]